MLTPWTMILSPRWRRLVNGWWMKEWRERARGPITRKSNPTNGQNRDRTASPTRLLGLLFFILPPSVHRGSQRKHTDGEEVPPGPASGSSEPGRSWCRCRCRCESGSSSAPRLSSEPRMHPPGVCAPECVEAAALPPHTRARARTRGRAR